MTTRKTSGKKKATKNGSKRAGGEIDTGEIIESILRPFLEFPENARQSLAAKMEEMRPTLAACLEARDMAQVEVIAFRGRTWARTQNVEAIKMAEHAFYTAINTGLSIAIKVLLA